MWCTRTSVLIMFGKFEKKFGRLDNEEKKLLGECILYISPLVNASSSASYLLLYRARPFSNISEREHLTFQVAYGALRLL